jgi:AAA+ ATPase superfamily predicted ATPase
MNEIIKRASYSRPLWTVLEDFHRKKGFFHELKTVCVFSGPTGCGKTTYILNYFKEKKFFYFSFAGLGEELAERLFAEKAGGGASGWVEAIMAVARDYKYVLLDDIASLATYKRFKEAFYQNMMTNIHTRPFVVLITQPIEDVTGLADNYKETHLNYFSIPEVIKLYPKLPKVDILGLCAISGGIPTVFREYDRELSFENNLRKLLKPDSAFINLLPELLLKHFRKTENYHHLLCAIAHGNHRVGKIGKFTGFTLNKCDRYLAELVAHGFVKANKLIFKNGRGSTAYRITNNYFLLWHKYVFQNRSGIQLEDEELTNRIVKSIIDIEIHEFHLKKSFLLMNARFKRDLWMNFRNMKKVVYSPQTLSDYGTMLTFDAVARNKQKMLFVKVFKDPLESCATSKLNELRQAVSLVNEYEDSYVYIFTKRRFSDYAVSRAARDNVLKLVEVDRLKY